MIQNHPNNISSFPHEVLIVATTRWLGAPAHPACVELPAALELPSCSSMVPYLFRVTTSDLKGAGTDANIEINLSGLKGESGWRRLVGGGEEGGQGAGGGIVRAMLAQGVCISCVQGRWLASTHWGT
jgi:hypothetical protein